jgi:hypothetical protein
MKPDLIEKYTNGRCYYLAAAIFYSRHLPLEFIFGANENAMCLLHCWNMLPNGSVLDIRGEQARSDVIRIAKARYDLKPELERFDWELHSNVTPEAIIGITGRKLHPNHPFVTRALKDFNRFVK